jgi:hypothetical protein
MPPPFSDASSNEGYRQGFLFSSGSISAEPSPFDGTSGQRQEIVIPGAANLTDLDEPSSESTSRGASTYLFGNSTPGR